MQAQPALLVPNVSLGNDQSGRYVLVVNKDGVVEQRKVEPGHLVGNLRVIEKGLTKDDHVVVGGIKHAIPAEGRCQAWLCSGSKLVERFQSSNHMGCPRRGTISMR